MSTTDASAPLVPTALSVPDSEAAPSSASTAAAVTPWLPVDLSDPIWTIHHVARALHLSVDRAREFTYTADFPAPRAGFSRNLWLRSEVLDWFDKLPTGERRTATTATRARRDIGNQNGTSRRDSSRPGGTKRTYKPRTAR